MKNLQLTVIAAVCALALTSCSSSGAGGASADKPSLATSVKNETVQTDNIKEDKLKKEQDKLAEKERLLQEEEKKLIEEKSRVLEQQQSLEGESQKLAKNHETLASQRADLEKTKADIERNKEALSKEKADLETAKARLADEIAKFEEEKNKPSPEQLEQARLEKNKAEVKKGFEPNGTFTKTYVDSSASNVVDNNSKNVEGTFSYVSGSHLIVENNQLANRAVVEQKINLNELELDGKTLPLYTKEEIDAHKKLLPYPTAYLVKEIKNGEQVIGKVGSLPKSPYRKEQSQMRYGYVTENGKTTLFVQGHLAPEGTAVRSPHSHLYYGANNEKENAGELLKPLRSAGVFEYIGSAFMGKDNLYHQYDAKAIVDFTNKKVKVDLSQENNPQLTFGGKISGNTFEGVYQGTHAKGAFYGTQGMDLGGTFYQAEGEHKDRHGVFGVTNEYGSFSGWKTAPADSLNDFQPE